MTAIRRLCLVAALGVATAACEDGVVPAVDLERMIVQEKYEPYEASPYFADGRVMRRPPAGTLPRERALGDPFRDDGIADGQYATRIPIPVTRPLVERGRRDFEALCAACHGILGDGESQVAANMSLRKPPTLVGAVAREFPPGRIFVVISEGYGLMRPYASELDVDRRWGVIAYVRALQKARGMPLAELPAPLRAQAEEALR